MKKDAHRVLVVDDDVDERFLTERALKKVMSGGSSVHLVKGGDEAIAYLIGEGRFSNRSRHPFPTIIITDLNMPDGDGFKVLEFLKANPAWSVVPRILFTSSESDDDVRLAFFLGASAYHVKPSGRSGGLLAADHRILGHVARAANRRGRTDSADAELRAARGTLPAAGRRRTDGAAAGVKRTLFYFPPATPAVRASTTLL